PFNCVFITNRTNGSRRSSVPSFRIVWLVLMAVLVPGVRRGVCRSYASAEVSSHPQGQIWADQVRLQLNARLRNGRKIFCGTRYKGAIRDADPNRPNCGDQWTDFVPAGERTPHKAPPLLFEGHWKTPSDPAARQKPCTDQSR